MSHYFATEKTGAFSALEAWQIDADNYNSAKLNEYLMENKYFVDRTEGPYRQGDFVPFQADQPEGQHEGEHEAEGEHGDDYPLLEALLSNQKRWISMTVGGGTAIDDRTDGKVSAEFDTTNTRGRRIVPNGESIRERWLPVYGKFEAWRKTKTPDPAGVKALFPTDNLCDPAGWSIPGHLDKQVEEEKIQRTRTLHFCRNFAQLVGNVDADQLENPNDQRS